MKVWAAVWAGALAIFVWLALDMRSGITPAFDFPVRTWVHAHSTPPVTALMRGFSLVGQPVILISLGALTVFWLVVAGRPRSALWFAIAVAGAEILDQLLKRAFQRTRPVPFFGIATPNSYSFPSGHALVSCTFCLSLAAIAGARIASRTRRWISYAAAAALTGAIGFSRIYLGVHYPSDVLGGYAAAAVWVIIVEWHPHQGRWR